MKAIQQNYGILFVLCFWAISLQSQVLIVPSYQNSELFFFDHLFQVNLVNSSNQTIQGVLEIDVENRNLERIVKVSSPLLALPAGGLLSSTEINWNSNIEFGKNQLISSFTETGRFPYGSYIFCYRFVSIDGTTLGVNCQEKATTIAGMPELISPYDKRTIQTPHPLLTWKPPLPMVSRSVSYNLRLCQKQQGQSIVQALRSNVPLLEQQSLNEPFLLYPTSALALEEGETYVWQIHAYFDGLELGETDIWEFTYELPDEEEKSYTPPVEGHRLVKKKLDASYYIATNIIHLAYDNRTAQAELEYDLFLENNQERSIKELPKIELERGLNQIDIDGRLLDGLEHDERYILRIRDKKGSSYYFKFIYYETPDN